MEEPIVAKAKRPGNVSKKKNYQRERSEIITRLNDILGITPTNNSFLLYDLETDERIKASINGLSDEIKIYYKTGLWHYFRQKNRQEQPLELGLVRAVYKDEGYQLSRKEKHITRNGEKIRTYLCFVNRMPDDGDDGDE